MRWNVSPSLHSHAYSEIRDPLRPAIGTQTGSVPSTCQPTKTDRPVADETKPTKPKPSTEQDARFARAKKEEQATAGLYQRHCPSFSSNWHRFTRGKDLETSDAPSSRCCTWPPLLHGEVKKSKTSGGGGWRATMVLSSASVVDPRHAPCSSRTLLEGAWDI
jgi:hypothetical protein